MSYEGVEVGTVECEKLGGTESTRSVRRLTNEERMKAAGRPLVCVRGLSHWVPVEFLLDQADDHDRQAHALREGVRLLAGIGPDDEIVRCGVCGDLIVDGALTVNDVEVGTSHAHHYDD